MSNTNYEWTCETLDEHGDIEESDFAASLAQSGWQYPAEGKDFGLVKVCGDHCEDKTWAYVRDGKLDEWMRDAQEKPIYKTPKRFLEEFEKFSKKSIDPAP